MPAMGGLTDRQIAAVLTYVRAEFGQQSPPVTAAAVKAIRAANATRELPWTAPELEK